MAFALAAVGLWLHSLSAVFIGLLLAELASAVVYELARRRRLRAVEQVAVAGR